jgi:hypothetical protein
MVYRELTSEIRSSNLGSSRKFDSALKNCFPELWINGEKFPVSQTWIFGVTVPKTFGKKKKLLTYLLQRVRKSERKTFGKRNPKIFAGGGNYGRLPWPFCLSLL